MPANIEQLLKDQIDCIDYDELIKKHPWIVEENHQCILSPDSDGLLCGLLMAKYKHWKIVGFYDDKVAVIQKNSLSCDPIFLDGEIFRPGIRSMGHHMVMLNKNRRPSGFDEGFRNCIQPNLLRNYDSTHHFRIKYPLATIHMLVSILAYHDKDLIKIPTKAIPALFFTDGVFNNLFSYPENVLNWLHYLRIGEEWNPLKNVFENDNYTVFTLMKEMNSFFRARDTISIPNERGDRLRISTKDGDRKNIEDSENTQTGECHINEAAASRVCSFMNLIGGQTGWVYNPEDWTCWNNLQFFKFTKGSFKGDRKPLTIQNFAEFIKKNPLSWAQTSGSDIEYTLEEPARLPFDILARGRECLVPSNTMRKDGTAAESKYPVTREPGIGLLQAAEPRSSSSAGSGKE